MTSQKLKLVVLMASIGASVALATVVSGMAHRISMAEENEPSLYDLPAPAGVDRLKAYETSDLSAPVRIVATEQPIDAGKEWGHCSPCVEDINKDGLPDLIVGDFSGKFRVYHNTGKPGQPMFASSEILKAGGVDAEVWIYCCIGAQPRFGDLDGDGIRDMISNSYDPGHCYLFRGRADGTLAAREEITDCNGIPVRLFPKQEQTYQSFGSFYELADWDADGDLDLIIGCFDGTLKVRFNEGSPTQPVFAADNTTISSTSGPIKVKAHFCPKVADWDMDGLWDIVAGCDDGSVTWYRNIGTASDPEFEDGQLLLQPHEGSGYNRLVTSQADVVPGIRTQVEVCDWNSDGKPDLLVGDFTTCFHFRQNLSTEQFQAATGLLDQYSKASRIVSQGMENLQKSFAEKYPGEAIHSEAADREWQEAYTKLKESSDWKSFAEAESQIAEQLRPFLTATRGDDNSMHNLAPAHGHVWLFLRK